MDEAPEETKSENIPIIDPSSLISLKAELLKRQEAVKQAKSNASDEPSKHRPFKVKGEIEIELRKRAITKSQSKASEDNEEERLALQRSRAALEAKSKLYDQLSSNKTPLSETEEELYLVDFFKKSARNRNYDTERTESADHNSAYRNNIVNHGTNSNNPETYGVSSSNGNPQADATHYQNIHFNERRNHGVGYFAFSTIEEERKQQMEQLNALHEKTKKRRIQHEEAMEKKKLSLESRLAKICKRRNIDPSLITKFTSKPTQESEITTDSSSVPVDLDSIPLPESEVEKKPAKVRPWDVGKQFINFQRASDV